ncbi:MAG: tripartite tricarboxylate transporter TctB family protein [Beijerinckiaceae bacterium]
MRIFKHPMTLVMLAIFVAMVAIASQWPEEARFMPNVLGIPAIGLCLLQVFLDLRAADNEPGEHRSMSAELQAAEARVSRMTGRTMHFEVAHDADLPEEEIVSEATAERREKAVWLAFAGLLAVVILFGFHIAVPLFLAGFLRFIAKLPWLQAISYAVIASLAMMGVFEYVLKTELHRGLLVEYFVA